MASAVYAQQLKDKCVEEKEFLNCSAVELTVYQASSIDLTVATVSLGRYTYLLFREKSGPIWRPFQQHHPQTVL